MQRSSDRILTTHTGSLPRPAGLTRLYARQSRGEAVDVAEVERAGKAALNWVVPKQVESGIDIGNNGEQQREGFFLHVRHRMSGFGGTWKHGTARDVEKYPAFKQHARRPGGRQGSGQQLPAAEGDRRGQVCGAGSRRRGMRGFPGGARRAAARLRRAVLDRSIPGHHRRSDPQRALRHRCRLYGIARCRPAGGIRSHRETRISAAAGSPRPRAGTAHLVPGPPALGFPRLRGARGRHDQHAPSSTSRAIGCGCMCAGAIRGPARLRRAVGRHLPALRRTNVGGLVLPFANPRHAHEIPLLRAAAGGRPGDRRRRDRRR